MQTRIRGLRQRVAGASVGSNKIIRPKVTVSYTAQLFVHHSVLHDCGEILLRIGDEVDVGDGVAIHQQQIGIVIFLNDADYDFPFASQQECRDS